MLSVEIVKFIGLDGVTEYVVWELQEYTRERKAEVLRTVNRQHALDMVRFLLEIKLT